MYSESSDFIRKSSDRNNSSNRELLKSDSPFHKEGGDPSSSCEARSLICKSFFDDKPFEELLILVRNKIDSLLKDVESIVGRTTFC